MKKADMDIILSKLRSGEIGLIQEMDEYIKELEDAYMKTLNSNSIKFKNKVEE